MQVKRHCLILNVLNVSQIATELNCKSTMLKSIKLKSANAKSVQTGVIMEVR